MILENGEVIFLADPIDPKDRTKGFVRAKPLVEYATDAIGMRIITNGFIVDDTHYRFNDTTLRGEWYVDQIANYLESLIPQSKGYMNE